MLTGFALGRHARRTARVDPYVCQCGHALAYHNDPDDSSCNHVSINALLDDVECACLGYVGERPLPELDPDAVIRRIGGNQP